MADKAVDLQAANGKTMELDVNLLDSDFFHPQMLPMQKSAQDAGGKTVIEPIMVKNHTGKKCVYYFDEGNHHLLEVVEGDTEAYLPERVQEVEVLFKKIWREVFSIWRIFTSFIVLFIVELIYYLIHYVLQPLILNSVSAIGNQFLKPFLTAVFNNIIQPVFTLAWNILNAFVTTVAPIMDLVAQIIKPVAMLLQSVRLFNVNYYSGTPQKKLENV